MKSVAIETSLKSMPIYPLLGLVSTALSTVLAVLFVPKELGEANSLFLPALILSFGLVLAPGLAVLSNLKTLGRAEHVVILSILPWILFDLLRGEYNWDGFTPEVLQRTFAAIGLYALSVWFIALIPFSKPSGLVLGLCNFKIDKRLIFSMIILFFVLTMFPYFYNSNFHLLLMFKDLGVARFSSPGGIGRYGSTIIDHLPKFGLFIPSFTYLLYLQSNRVSIEVVTGILLSIIAACFLLNGGTRSVLIGLAGIPIAMYFLSRPRIKFNHLIKVFILLMVVAQVGQILFEARTIGFRDYFSKAQTFIAKGPVFLDDNFNNIAQVVRAVPDDHPFTYEKPFIYWLCLPIPRALWPNKPKGPGFDLPEFRNDPGVTITLSITMIGEWYMSIGLLSVIFGGLFHGYCARITSSVLLVTGKEQYPLVLLMYSYLIVWLFLGMRSMLALIWGSYALLGWYLLASVFMVIVKTRRTVVRKPLLSN